MDGLNKHRFVSEAPSRSGAGAWVCAVLLLSLVGAQGGCTRPPDDGQLTQQIQSKLNQDSGLQGKSLTVETSGGVVTLSGTVDDEGQRVAAARYASTTLGVRQIVNNLQIAAPPSTALPMQVSNVPVSVVGGPQPKPRTKVRHERRNSRSSERRSSKPSAVDADSSGTALLAKTQDGYTSAAHDAPTEREMPASEPEKLTIEAGTGVVVRLVESLDSETAQVGQTFHATLDSPLQSDWKVAIPAGSEVEGHVVDVKSAGKFAGQSQLVLQLDRISADGRSYDIRTDQYQRQGSNRTTNTAAKVGTSAAIGAIIGGIAGGGKGAGIGAAAGAGVGGGVQAVSKGQQIKLGSETVLHFTLKSPVTVMLVEQESDSVRPKLNFPK